MRDVTRTQSRPRRGGERVDVEDSVVLVHRLLAHRFPVRCAVGQNRRGTVGSSFGRRFDQIG